MFIAKCLDVILAKNQECTNQFAQQKLHKFVRDAQWPLRVKLCITVKFVEWFYFETSTDF